MSVRFEVTPEDLSTFSDRVLAIAQALGEASDIRHRYDGISGSREVDDALADFFRHWSDGMHSIHEDLTETGQRLAAAADAYAETDAGVERSAGGGSW